MLVGRDSDWTAYVDKIQSVLDKTKRRKIDTFNADDRAHVESIYYSNDDGMGLLVEQDYLCSIDTRVLVIKRM